MFPGVLGWERDIAPVTSEAPALAAALLPAALADVAFAVGEVALRRRQAVQLNFQIRKPEIDPDTLPAYPTFDAELRRRLCSKVRRWMRTVRPYTVHTDVAGFLRGAAAGGGAVRALREGARGGAWSVLVVAGELRCLGDAQVRDDATGPGRGAPGGRGLGLTGRCVGRGLSAQRSSHPATRC